MLIWIVALAAVMSFVYLLTLFKVVDKSKTVIRLSGQVMSVLGDRKLTDLEKEKAMQRFSLQFFQAFFVIVLRAACALAIPLCTLWLLGLAGLLSFEALKTVYLDWRFLVASTTLAVIILVLVSRRGKAS